MTKRCIMIFPRFSNMELINRLRKKYDPLAEKVNPHITLVFPFDSSFSKEELQRHIEEVASQASHFSLSMQKVTPAMGNYLFLNISEGKEEVIMLHQMLYQGILKDYHPCWLKNINYMPHMTVGKIENDIDFSEAVKETKGMDELFTTIVDKITVEIIGENDESIIEMEIPLRK